MHCCIRPRSPPAQALLVRPLNQREKKLWGKENLSRISLRRSVKASSDSHLPYTKACAWSQPNLKLPERRNSPQGTQQTPQNGPGMRRSVFSQGTGIAFPHLTSKFQITYDILHFLSTSWLPILAPFPLVLGKVCSVCTTSCANLDRSPHLAGLSLSLCKAKGSYDADDRRCWAGFTG